jgi:hypothetical protein
MILFYVYKYNLERENEKFANISILCNPLQRNPKNDCELSGVCQNRTKVFKLPGPPLSAS